jgi:hypothetical protein
MSIKQQLHLLLEAINSADKLLSKIRLRPRYPIMGEQFLLALL